MSRRKINFRNPLLNAFVGFIFVIIVAGTSFIAGRITAPATVNDNRQQPPPVQAEQKVTNAFDFSVKDQTGKEITKIKFQPSTADLQQQIIIQGQRATAIKGKTFLIINFSITNNSNKYIQLNSRDYVRMQTDNGELAAPDIHNDPIQIQPISTKVSRLGFAVDDTQKQFTLQIGELDGKKTNVTLNF